MTAVPSRRADGRIRVLEENARVTCAMESCRTSGTVGNHQSIAATESFISAASFRRPHAGEDWTAVRGHPRHVRGLKENVIVGRLIRRVPVGLSQQAAQADRFGLPTPSSSIASVQASASAEEVWQR